MLLIAVVIQFVRPARSNPPVNPGATITARLMVPKAVEGILDRSCRDCHSNETRWPWYSNVAPVSWFVIDHVNHGRSHFNYSNWAQYRPDESAGLLKDSCALAQKGAMPLPSYLWMHGHARLEAPDIETLCTWTRATVALLPSPE